MYNILICDDEKDIVSARSIYHGELQYIRSIPGKKHFKS